MGASRQSGERGSHLQKRYLVQIIAVDLCIAKTFSCKVFCCHFILGEIQKIIPLLIFIVQYVSLVISNIIGRVSVQILKTVYDQFELRVMNCSMCKNQMFFLRKCFNLLK